MASHNDFGKEGEELAALWLSERGYDILHRNWRFGKLEIDIVAKKNEKLHIIEVKTRKGNFFGLPEDGVKRKNSRISREQPMNFCFVIPVIHGFNMIFLPLLYLTLKNRSISF